jgi:hypothetical protein
VKKAPDPGSATLPYTDLHVLIQIILLARWLQWSRSQIILLLLTIFFLLLLWLSLGARTSLKGGKGVCVGWTGIKIFVNFDKEEKATVANQAREVNNPRGH